LFDLTTSITLPAEEFDKVWPFVSSVYSAKQHRVLENGTPKVSKYECRLRKSRKSSTVRPMDDGKQIKRRHGSSARESHQCQVRIRIVRTLTLNASDSELQATVSREDKHEHLHSIEDSFQVKKPVAIRAVAKERAKNYLVAQVYNAVKGVGTPNGSEQLELAGSGSLTRLVDSDSQARAADLDFMLIPQGRQDVKMLRAVFDPICV
jgi:hypothetical protein